MKKRKITLLMSSLHIMTTLYLLPIAYMIYVLIYDVRQISYDNYRYFELYVGFTVVAFVLTIWLFGKLEQVVNVAMDFNIYISILYMFAAFISLLFFLCQEISFYLIATTWFLLTIILDKMVFNNKLKDVKNPIRSILFVRNLLAYTATLVIVSNMFINIV